MFSGMAFAHNYPFSEEEQIKSADIILVGTIYATKKNY
jgi:hypothetical protein